MCSMLPVQERSLLGYPEASIQATQEGMTQRMIIIGSHFNNFHHAIL